MRDGSLSNAVRFIDRPITLTNDESRWGLWAGKVITGDASVRTIYAIAANGLVKSLDLGFNPEDFDIIPPDPDLYCVNLHPYGSSSMLKLSRQVLANYVGDLLMTQAGGFDDGTALFIVSWNGTDF